MHVLCTHRLSCCPRARTRLRRGYLSLSSWQCLMESCRSCYAPSWYLWWYEGRSHGGALRCWNIRWGIARVLFLWILYLSSATQIELYCTAFASSACPAVRGSVFVTYPILMFRAHSRAFCRVYVACRQIGDISRSTRAHFGIFLPLSKQIPPFYEYGHATFFLRYRVRKKKLVWEVSISLSGRGENPRCCFPDLKTFVCSFKLLVR